MAIKSTFLKLLLLAMLFGSACASAQPLLTTDVKDYQTAKKRLYIGTDSSKYFTTIVSLINSASKKYHVPTAKAVYDFVQTIIPEVYELDIVSALPDPPIPQGSIAVKTIDVAGHLETYAFNGTDWILIAGPSVSGDDWGDQVVQHDGTLSGDGTEGTPLQVDTAVIATLSDVYRIVGDSVGTNGHVIRDDGTNKTQRGYLNFVSTSTVNAVCTDDGGNNETEVALNIPTDGITATQIAADAVGTSEIAANGVGTSEITNSAVTYAKIQVMTASRLLGNPTGSSAPPSEIQLGAGLNFLSSTTLRVGDGTGNTNRIPWWSSSTALTSASDFTYDGSTFQVGSGSAFSRFTKGGLRIDGSGSTNADFSFGSESTGFNLQFWRGVNTSFHSGLYATGYSAASAAYAANSLMIRTGRAGTRIGIYMADGGSTDTTTNKKAEFLKNGTFRLNPNSNFGAGNVIFDLYGDASQTGNLTNWRNNSGTVLTSIEADGKANVAAFKMVSGATDGYVLTSDASGNGTWQAASGGGSTAPEVTEYATAGSYTYTIPAGATALEIECTGSGGGGASGQRNTAGTIRRGSAGGGGGGYSKYVVVLSEIGSPSTVSVTVGAAGAGGASVTTNSTAGTTGGDGNESSVTYGGGLPLCSAFGGKGGTGGSGSTAGTGGNGGEGMYRDLVAPSGASGSLNGASPTDEKNIIPGGGAAGAGIFDDDDPRTGATGGAAFFGKIAGPASGSNASMGSNTWSPVGPGGSGGSATGSGAGNPGGNGIRGGGGGGGGTAPNGSASGAGGDGGAGFVRITAKF